ncbi:hypothetical protein N7G274_000155 [Stereocaulon virgatum]|uniref:Uncharacterized protein n=1 Tax=Stereocaulon virgatum TaxID=373712 RepID=A0ABR4AUE6_9LECA
MGENPSPPLTTHRTAIELLEEQRIEYEATIKGLNEQYNAQASTIEFLQQEGNKLNAEHLRTQELLRPQKENNQQQQTIIELLKLRTPPTIDTPLTPIDHGTALLQKRILTPKIADPSK